MKNIIDETKKITVGTTAVNVDTAFRTVLIVNASDTQTIYFKDAADGEGAAADNGFALLPKTMMQIPLVCDKLSMIADDAGADVRLLFLR